MLLKRVLIIDDDSQCRAALNKFLSNQGYEIRAVNSGQEALGLLEQQFFHVVLVDLKLPDIDGMRLVSHIRENLEETISIVVTGYGTTDSAVEAIKTGAYHYITKPFDLQYIKNLIEKAIGYHELKQETSLIKKQLRTIYQFENIIGESPAMLEIFSLIEKIAASDSTVLVTGESGTGKELIAKAIHYRSLRNEKPLVTVNCGAITETLLEAELFGHVKGSFTGAIANRAGRFEMAHKGTLFLDEIGNMSQALQVKLLRVLQTKTFEPVGGNTRSVDVRIVAATNQDLEKAVKQQQFREDLYYRLNVIPIHIPPLRQRKEDIPPLIRHFVTTFNKLRKAQNKITGMTDEALKIMIHYAWPGNARELENILERIMVLKGEGLINSKDLPEKLFQGVNNSTGGDVYIPEEGISFEEVVNNFEKSILTRVLQKTKWNRNRAAKLLNLKRTTLIEKLKRKKITKPI